MKMNIQKKISVLVIAICLFTVLSLSITFFVMERNISSRSHEVSSTLSKDAADGASSIIISQAHNFLQIIAREESKACNDMLNTIRQNILLVEGVVQDIFRNPHAYPYSRPIVPPAEAVEGVFTDTYSLPQTVRMDDSIRRELDLVSNLGLLMPLLVTDPNIIELYVGLESGLFYNYTPFIYENPEYDARTRPWYRAAAENPETVIFTDVYEDAWGTGMVLTAAKAVHDDNGRLIGVAGLDIQLANLKEMIDSIRINPGYVFIIDRNGEYVVHPDMGPDGCETLIADIRQCTYLAEGYERMITGEEGFHEGEIDGRKVFLTFSPISVAGWSVGVITYADELLSSLDLLISQMEDYTMQAEVEIADMSSSARLILSIFICIIVVMVTLLAVSLTRMISRPIQELTAEVAKIGEGDFKHRIPVKSSDEIGTLTESFNSMADNLYNYAMDIISLSHEKVTLQITANTDALTGIPNRQHFMDLASKETERAARTGETSYFVLFDIDNFKKINDTYGHPVGDKVLQCVTKRVRETIRPYDLFARYGGEEFILLFTNVAQETVSNLVERIRRSICDRPILIEDIQITTSASFGGAPVCLEKSFESAISNADKALYTAKNEGCNKTVFYENAGEGGAI